tara:strand:+ start:154 stop:318 length:165 start_codon:yes stop_codon:yes gene_type:complete
MSSGDPTILGNSDRITEKLEGKVSLSTGRNGKDFVKAKKPVSWYSAATPTHLSK